LLSGTFKRIPSGLLVAAPRLWPFGSAQHYLASEAQQVEIEARMTKARRAYAAIAFVLMVVGLIVAGEIGVADTSGFLGLYTLAVVVIVAGSQFCTWLALRPLFAALPRSSERITFADRARINAVSAPLWRLLASDLFLALLAVWLAAIGFNGLADHFSLGWTSVVSAWL
jgi:hypothetical protein